MGDSLPYNAKNRVNGLLDSEDGIIIFSLVLTQYRRVPGIQTDGQTDRNAVAHHSCAL